VSDLSTVKIYYDKLFILKRIGIGLASISLGVTAFIFFEFQNFIFDYKNGDSKTLFIWYIKFIIVFSPVYWGTLRLARTIFRLFTNKPQIILDFDGVFTSKYEGWGKVEWRNIDGISIGDRKTTFGHLESCLIIGLSDSLIQKAYEPEITIKTQYLNMDEDMLLELTKKFWLQANRDI
jgi:hypothetical protein